VSELLVGQPPAKACTGIGVCCNDSHIVPVRLIGSEERPDVDSLVVKLVILVIDVIRAYKGINTAFNMTVQFDR
jgi:hypothetical protein